MQKLRIHFEIGYETLQALHADHICTARFHSEIDKHEELDQDGAHSDTSHSPGFPTEIDKDLNTSDMHIRNPQPAKEEE